MLASRIITPFAALRSAPVADAALDSECLYGERFDGEQTENGFWFGTLGTDGYQGWVPQDCLGDMPAPTARLIAPMSDVTASADIKSPSNFALSLGALVTITTIQNDRAKIITASGHGFLPCQHLLPLAPRDDASRDDVAAIDAGIADKTAVRDWVAVAEHLVGSPYKWGGRCAWGLDCSALVQLALAAGGMEVPRDSGPQRQIGIGLDDRSDLQRGDLVFWHGHVGIMQDGERLLHANAHHMAVASEPLAEAVQRIGKSTGPITALRRPMI